MHHWQFGESGRYKLLSIVAATVFTLCLMAPSEGFCVAVEAAGFATEEEPAQLVSCDAADYYASLAPCLDTIWNGNYYGIVNDYVVVPVVAKVGSSTGVLTNAPVLFDAGNGPALFSASPNGDPSTCLTTYTYADGQAIAWVFLPATFALTNPLTVTV